MNVFIVTQLSNVDGEHIVNAVPCADLHSAKAVMDEEIRTLLSESPKYKNANLDEIESNYAESDYILERSETSFYIECMYDNYSERIEIEEKPLMVIQ